MRQTRARLDPLVPGDRQVFVVSSAHEKYYREELADAEDSLVIAQPMNRGTAVGIIAALVRIMQTHPDAVVGFFPCDHHYSDDETFRCIVSSATAGARKFPDSLVIVGAEAMHAETEYGWIDPGEAISQMQGPPLWRVNRFWEKPALAQARALHRPGCLWNTFVTVGTAPTFLELLCSEVPDVVCSVTRALAGKDLTGAYARLPSVDFSRDIRARQAQRLGVSRFRLGMGGPWQPGSRARCSCQERRSAGLVSRNKHSFRARTMTERVDRSCRATSAQAARTTQGIISCGWIIDAEFRAALFIQQPSRPTWNST